ncbi:MAG: TetR/AcrR family transcriptional regulator C-terminal domain-containing protein [Candidatus Limnocylindrales bacterium]
MALSAEPRARLTRERVLLGAMAMADEGGIEGLSMRRLARTLGVEAMSLYHYAQNKDDILGGIVDLVVREIELPTAEGDWKPSVRASAISAHNVLRRHPWACDLLMSGPRISPARLRMIDALVGRLTDAGLPDEQTDLAYHALDAHILGFTLWEAGYTTGLKDMPTDLATVVRELNLDEYPNLLAHAEYHQRPRRPGQKTEFEFGLDLILDGLEVSSAPGRPAAGAAARDRAGG